MLVWRDLQYRKWRVVAVTLLMAVVITLLFLMSGLVGQFRAEPRLGTQSVGSDMAWILPEGTGGPFTSGKAIPASAVASIEDVEPILVGRGYAVSSGSAQAVVIVGRSFSSIDQPALTTGRYPDGVDQVVTDATLGFAVGHTFELSGASVEVVGVTRDATVLAGLPLVFSQLAGAQSTLASAEPVVVGALTHDASAILPPGLRLMTAEEVMADTLVPLEPAISSVGLTRGLLWLITAIVIAAVVYVGVLERTRDFAVLKAVGARNRDLASSILLQGVVMTLLATALAALLQFVVAPAFPLTIRIPASAWWQIPFIAVVVSLIAGAGGVWKVSSTSPAEAFS